LKTFGYLSRQSLDQPIFHEGSSMSTGVDGKPPTDSNPAG
jgi:hypothetical protein